MNIHKSVLLMALLISATIVTMTYMYYMFTF